MSRVATRWIEWSSDGTAGPFTLSSAGNVFSVSDGTSARIQVGPGNQVFIPADTTMQGGLEVLGTTTIVNADDMHSDKLTIIHSVNDPAIYATQTGPLSTAPVVLIDSSGTGNALQVVGINSTASASVLLGNDATSSMLMSEGGGSNSGVAFGQPLKSTALIQGRQVDAMAIGTQNASPLILGTNDTARLIISKDGDISYGTDGELTFNNRILGIGGGFYYHIGELTITATSVGCVVHGFSTVSVTTNGNVYHSNWVLKVRQVGAMGTPPAASFWTVNETAPYIGFSTIAVIRQNDVNATRVDLYTYSPEPSSILYYDLSFFPSSSAATFAKEISVTTWDNVGTKIPEESRTTMTEITTEGDFRFNLALVDSEGVGAQGEGSGIVLGDLVGANVYGLAGIKAYKADATANTYSGQLHFQTRLNGNLAKTQMVIDQNGAVGVGTTAPKIGTTAAIQTLTVYDPSSRPMVELASGAADAAGVIEGEVTFSAPNNTAATLKRIARVTGFTDGATAGGRGGKLTFDTRAPGAGAGDVVVRMVIDSAGNVGIGTTNAVRPLDVYMNNGNTSTGAMLIEQAGSGNSWFNIGMTGGNMYAVGVDHADSDKFKISFSSSGLASNPRIVVDTAGNVGIGTTTMSGTFVVKPGSVNNGISVQGTATSASRAFLGVDGSSHGLFELIDNAGNVNVLVGASSISYINGGNVGIGTTNPLFKLHVVGSVAAVENIGASPMLYLRETTNTFPGILAFPNVLQIQNSSNVVRMTIDAVGNVGINTTPTSIGGDVRTLDIRSVNNTGLSGGGIVLGTPGVPKAYVYSVGSDLWVYPTSGKTLMGPAQTVAIDPNGFLGIGTTTPLALLHANGTMRWGGVSTNYADSGEDTSGLYLEQFGNTAAKSVIRLQTSKSSDNTNWAQFFIDPNNGFSFINLGTGNNNVGIGTTPAAKLDVYSAPAANLLSLHSAATLAGSNDYVSWSSVGPNSGGIRAGGSWGYDTQLYSGQALTFKAGGFSAGSPHVTILTNGIVGIGTTNALAQLHVKGSGNTGVIVDGGTGTSEPFLQFYQNGTATGYIQQRNAGYLEYQSKASGPHYFIGNVGVGTTSPLYNLHVFSASAAGTYSMVRNTSAAGTAFAGMGVANNSNTSVQMLAFSTGYSGTTYGGIPNADMGLIFANQTGGLLIEQFAAYPIYMATNNVVRMTILSNGFVGIGSTSPQYPLDVTGFIRTLGSGANGVYFNNTGGGQSQISNTNIANLTFYTGVSPTVAMTIDESSNVGIGITSMTTIASAVEMGTTSGTRTEFVNINYSTSSSTRPALRLIKSHTGTKGSLVTTVSGENTGSLVFMGVNTANAIGFSAQVRASQTGSAGTTSVPSSMFLETSNSAGSAVNTNQLVLTSSGFVGVGTSGPPDLVSVWGQGSSTKMSLYSGAAGSFMGLLMGRIAEEAALGVSAVGSQWVNGSVAGDFCIRSSNKLLLSGDAGTTAGLVVAASTSVGIGSTTPQSALTLYGNAGTGAPVPGACTIYLNDPTDAVGSGGGVVIGGLNGTTFAGIKGFLTNGSSNTTGDLRFYTRTNATDGSLSPQMTILSNGRVGVGTTAPTSQLTVSGGDICVENDGNPRYLVLTHKGGNNNGLYFDYTPGKLGMWCNTTALVVCDSASHVGINQYSPAASLHVTGSVAVTPTSVSTTYTVAATDYILLCNSAGGPFTINLPAAISQPAGRLLVFKSVGSANTISVHPAGADFIDGANINRSISNYTVLRLVCDGASNWYQGV